jgi:lambda family phage portal protein
MSSWFETPLGQSIIKERDSRAIRPVRARSGAMQQRMYASARQDRLTAGWSPSNSSADSELVTSLQTLRSRSRALCRDSSYAKRARALVVNNVIGQGIGLQAQVYTSRDTLNARINDNIGETWEEWCEAENCHTGGRLHFKSFERALLAQVFETGEVFIRKHARPFGRSDIPFTLELIEAERVAEEFQFPGLQASSSSIVRLGVELDTFYKPVAYYVRKRHPSEFRFHDSTGDWVERVPADQIIHLALCDRWPQTRGEPWLHTVVRRLNDLDGYTEAEVVRARAQAVRMGIIQTPNDAMSFGEVQDDGSVEMQLEPGMVTRLNPGETWQDSAPSAPNPQLDPFMRYMLREMAAGVGVSYESLSRDYSQSNYSSSRLALLDDRDLWRAIQGWFILDFRQKIHREWMQAAVLSRSISGLGVEEYATNPRKFESVRFRPRGWGWVDPTKEVEAFKAAVRCGFMTGQDVVSQSGADFEEVIEQRKKELAQAAAAGVVLDTDPSQVASSGAINAPPEKPDEERPGGKSPDDPEENPPERRVSSFLRPVK